MHGDDETPTPERVTALLVRWTDGDANALDALMPLVYLELRKTAHGLLRRERADHTLQPTALVHEAWLRRELGERGIEGLDVDRLEHQRNGRIHVVERHARRMAAAFGGMPGPRMFDEDAAHGDGGDAEEVMPALDRRCIVGQPQERFVDERRRLQRVVAALGPHGRHGEPAQLAIEHVEERCHRVAIAVRGAREQQCDVRRRLGFLGHGGGDQRRA